MTVRNEKHDAGRPEITLKKACPPWQVNSPVENNKTYDDFGKKMDKGIEVDIKQ